MPGGKGIGGALGIAGFTNGECFRIGDPAPAVYVARCFIRLNISLKKNKYDNAEEDANQLTGEKVVASRVTITAGKFSIADFYDDNRYSHAPRTQFMNWALMSNGLWDYP
jgi:high affinity Mn2+ porin